MSASGELEGSLAKAIYVNADGRLETNQEFYEGGDLNLRLEIYTDR